MRCMDICQLIYLCETIDKARKKEGWGPDKQSLPTQASFREFFSYSPSYTISFSMKIAFNSLCRHARVYVAPVF